MVRDGIGFQPIPGVGVAVLPVDIEIDFNFEWDRRAHCPD